MSLEITARDREGVDVLEATIRKMAPDVTAQIKCFNREEAEWIRAQLEARGVQPDRFVTSWMVFS